MRHPVLRNICHGTTERVKDPLANPFALPYLPPMKGLNTTRFALPETVIPDGIWAPGDAIPIEPGSPEGRYRRHGCK